MWWFSRRVPVCGRRFILEQLEERIVFDAAIAVDQIDAHTTDTPDPAGGDPGTSQVQAAPETAAAAPPPPDPDPIAQIYNQDLSVVLMSNALDQVDALSHAAAPDAKVVVYDAQAGLSGAVDQLASLVSSTGEKIDHLAVLSHGAPGIVEVGAGQVIDPLSVVFDPAPWNQLGALLDAGARIDLYGCNIGEGPSGLLLVQAIAYETGATVWASDDATGNVEGADWDLEVRVGVDAADYLINAQALASVSVLLDWSPDPSTANDLANTFTNNSAAVGIAYAGNLFTYGGDDNVTNNYVVEGGIYLMDGNDTYTSTASANINQSGAHTTKVTGVINGGDGEDEIFLGGTGASAFVGGVDGGPMDDKITNWHYVEGDIWGGEGADEIHICTLADSNNPGMATVAWGHVGRDILGGGGDDEILIGQATVDPGLNLEWKSRVNGNVNGGADTDTIMNYGWVQASIVGEWGTDTIENYGTVSGYIYGDGGPPDHAGDGNDTIRNYGTVKAAIYGLGGNDYIYNNGVVTYDMSGHDGDDTIINDASGDAGSIDGGSGADRIENRGELTQQIQGSAGDDTIINTGWMLWGAYGGLGNDAIVNSGVIHSSIWGEEGNDVITLNYGGWTEFGVDAGTGNDVVHVYTPAVGAHPWYPDVQVYGGMTVDSSDHDEINFYTNLATSLTVYGADTESMVSQVINGTTYNVISKEFETTALHGSVATGETLDLGSYHYWHITGTAAAGSCQSYTQPGQVVWDNFETLIHANNKPMLDNGGSLNLPSVNEDTDSHTYLCQLIQGAATDIITDSDALYTSHGVEGIAITGVNNTSGTWWYSEQSDRMGPQIWHDIQSGSVSDTHALLLNVTPVPGSEWAIELKFIPNDNWNGTITDGLTFRAWDQVWGVSETYVNTLAPGWNTSFSDATETIGVRINPVNDTPRVSAAFQDVAYNEDSGAHTISLLEHFSDIETPAANLTYSVTVTYADGLSGNATVNNATDQLTLTFDANSNGTAHVTVTATDTGDGTDTTLRSVSGTFHVTVNPVNDAPVITEGASVSAFFAENGTGTLYQPHAIDVDGDRLVWSLSGSDAACFNIAPGDGLITFKAAPNFEAPTDVGGDNVYNLTVTVTDTGGLSEALTANVTVVNVIETAPTITSGGGADSFAVYYAEHATGTVYAATETDPDVADAITWRLSGTDAGMFNISLDGLITFKEAPNFEAPADAGGDNIYNITVTAVDRDNLTDVQTLVVTVTDLNEAPSATNMTQTWTLDENSGPLALDDIVVKDVDANEQVTATLTLNNPASGTLSTKGGETYDPITGVWVVTGGLTEVNAALASVTFIPASNWNGAALITTHVADGAEPGTLGSPPAYGTITVTVHPVNDNPVALDVKSSGDEDLTFRLLDAPGWAVAFQDLIDDGDGAHDDPMQLLIIGKSNLHGTLTYGDGSAVGNTVDWNKLSDVHYTSDPNFNGTASFTYKVQDAGGGNDLSLNTATMTITVAPVNDAPTATDPGGASINTDDAHSVAVPGVYVSDVDVHEGTGLIHVTLFVHHGVLSLGGMTGGVVAYTGTLAQVNAALAGLIYSPSAYAGSSDVITLIVNDLGNTGKGGALGLTKTIPISISVTAGGLPTDNPGGMGDVDDIPGVHDLGAVPAPYFPDGGLMSASWTSTAVNSIVSLLEGAGLWPWTQAPTGQGESYGGWASFRTDMGLSLFGTTEEVRESAMDRLLTLTQQGGRVTEQGQLLNLQDFVVKMREWRNGVQPEELYLMFNSDEIHLTDWFAALRGPLAPWPLQPVTEPFFSQTAATAWWTKPAALVFNLNDTTAWDVFTCSEVSPLGAESGAPSSATQTLAVVFDLNQVSFMELVRA